MSNVVRAMQWVDQNLNSASCVAVQQAFLFWGQLYLDDSPPIVQFENNPDSAVDTALQLGYNQVYFVWWNQPIGWYGVSVPQGFVSVQDFGRISVYVYGGMNIGGN